MAQLLLRTQARAVPISACSTGSTGSSTAAGAVARGASVEPPFLPIVLGCPAFRPVEVVALRSLGGALASTGTRVKLSVLVAPGAVIGGCGSGVPHMPQNRILLGSRIRTSYKPQLLLPLETVLEPDGSWETLHYYALELR